MQSENFSEEQICNLYGFVSGGNGEEVGKLGEPVNHHHYAIFSLGFWQANDEVHGNVFPFLLGNRQGLKQTSWLHILVLILLETSALLDVGHYILPEPSPRESLPDGLLGLSNT